MNRSLSDILRAVHAVLTRLFAGRAPRIGLEVSDQAVRVLFEKQGVWELEAIALPPGTMSKGKVLNAQALLQAFAELRRRITGGDGKRRVGVHVSLTSAPVYAQQVSIPMVSSSELEAAVRLNVQVSAPVPLDQLAWGWQPLPGQQPPVILAAWTDRESADQVVALLAEANFLPASLEPKVLSLARLVRELYPNGATIACALVHVDESGVTISVIDKGILRFQYARGWGEVSTGGEITYPMLEAMLRREVPQVAGFYAQRGGAPLTELLIASPMFVEDMSRTLTELGFVPRELRVGSDTFPVQGYAAFGAALRGGIFSATDQPDLSLLGGQVLAWLRRELVVRVASFWTVVTPLAFSILLATLVAAYLFVGRIHKAVLAGTGQANPVLLAELGDREQQAKEFNTTVSTLATIQAGIHPRAQLMRRILEKAQQSGVTISRVTITPDGSASAVAGLAGGDSQLVSFKRALETDPQLSSVTLPIADLRTGSDGTAFTMTFAANLAAPVTTSTTP